MEDQDFVVFVINDMYLYLCKSSQSQGCRNHMATLEQSAARQLQVYQALGEV